MFRNCPKSTALAFEQALAMESDLAARHVSYAKVQESLGRPKKMLESLERAVELDETPQTLKILADAYERNGQEELAEELRIKIIKMTAAQQPQPRHLKQPRRVVM